MKRKSAIVTIVLSLLAIAGALSIEASPAYASATACGGQQCTFVRGSGSTFNHIENYASTPGLADYGHMQARWHSLGRDLYQNSADGSWGYDTPRSIDWGNVSIIVDANTYVCSRFWRKTSTGYTLAHGDWVCVKTHP
jgi:hypothetical protein